MTTPPPELTPEEMIAITSDPMTMMQTSGMAIMAALANPAAMAGLLMIIQDILSGECVCESCTRIRETFGTLSAQWDQMFPDGPVGLPFA